MENGPNLLSVDSLEAGNHDCHLEFRPIHIKNEFLLLGICGLGLGEAWDLSILLTSEFHKVFGT